MEYDERDPLDEAPLLPEPERDGRGRFRKGSSGNPKGRRMEFPHDPSLPASRRRVINQVADEIVEVKVNGKPQRMTMFEANVRSLALDGTRNRVAAQRFIELANFTSEADLQRRLSILQIREHMDRLEQENERLRQAAGQTSGTVYVPVNDLNDWDPHRVVDDEEAVDAATSPRSRPD
jgi:hypothetical protein